MAAVGTASALDLTLQEDCRMNKKNGPNLTLECSKLTQQFRLGSFTNKAKASLAACCEARILPAYYNARVAVWRRLKEATI